jgi:hypothetical protein
MIWLFECMTCPRGHGFFAGSDKEFMVHLEACVFLWNALRNIRIAERNSQ